MLRASGHEIDHGDPINWLRKRNEDMRRFYSATTLDGYIADRARLPGLALRRRTRTRPARSLRRLHQGRRRDLHGRDDLPVDPRPQRPTGDTWAYEQPVLGVHPPRVRTTARRSRFTTDESGGARRDADSGGGQGRLGGRRWRPRRPVRDAGLLDELIVYIAPSRSAPAPALPAGPTSSCWSSAQNKAFACARYAVRGARA